MLSTYKFKYLWLYYAYDSSKWCPWSLIFFCCHKRGFLFFSLLSHGTVNMLMLMTLLLLVQNCSVKTYLKVCLCVSKLCNVCSFRCRAAGKKIEEKKFTCEPGGIFCAVCNSYSWDGTHIEDGDLTTHLTSETHELEVSIILLNYFLLFGFCQQMYHKPHFNLSTDVWELL